MRNPEHVFVGRSLSFYVNSVLGTTLPIYMEVTQLRLPCSKGAYQFVQNQCQPFLCKKLKLQFVTVFLVQCTIVTYFNLYLSELLRNILGTYLQFTLDSKPMDAQTRTEKMMNRSSLQHKRTPL